MICQIIHSALFTKMNNYACMYVFYYFAYFLFFLLEHFFLHCISPRTILRMYSNISSVVECQRWWFLKSKIFGQESTYRTRAIITHGLYTFYPLFKVQKRFFKGLFFLKFWPYVWLVFKSGF